MEVINPQLKELERRHEELRSTVDLMRGELNELKRTASDTRQQTIWQFVIFTVTMAGILIAGTKYQADVLRNEMNSRFNEVNGRFNEVNGRFAAIEKRIEQSEKNILDRFEDLKQEVRANRK